jgi:hypothetical protein
MSQKKGAVGKNITQEGSPNVAELKSLVKWEKSNGKKMLVKEIWGVSSRYSKRAAPATMPTSGLEGLDMYWYVSRAGK